MASTTYETNSYEEVDNSSEKSKDYASSNSSQVDDVKKRNSSISFEDNKDKKDEKSKSRRSKRNSFRIFNSKEEKEEKEGKEGKEGKESGGLVRSLSGLFNKDKDKDKDKRNGTSESLRPASRTSSNSQNRRSFIFLSDDDGLEFDTTLKKGRKSRQSSSAEGLEKENSTKKGNRLSVNLNNLNFGKLLGFDENKSSPKSNEWEDNFLEPEETLISPRSPKNSFYAGSPSKKNKPNDVEYVESPRKIHQDNSIRTNGINKSYSHDDTSKSQNNSINESPIDDVIEVQSTNSSTRPSSLDDQDDNDYNRKTIDDNQPEEIETPSTPITPMTPRLFVTRPYPDSTEFTSNITNNSNQVEVVDDDDDIIKEDQVADSNVESKHDEVKNRNFEHLIISTNNLNSNVKERKIENITNTIDDNNDTIANTIYDNNTATPTQFPNKDSIFSSFRDDAEIGTNEQVFKKLQELEFAKKQLEAKVAEQNGEISKFNSMEQIMQQQVELTERMTETMHRLESKQKDESDSSNVGKLFEDTIQRLEEKIDEQKKELNQLRFIVGQLTGNQSFLIANGEFPRLEEQNLIVRHGEENQVNRTQSYSGSTLVSSLVVNPLCNTITVSATIATSVLYAVYIRPIVGLVGLVSVAKNARNARSEM